MSSTNLGGSLESLQETVDVTCRLINKLRAEKEELLKALQAALPWLKAQQAAHDHTKDCPYCFVVDISEAAIQKARGGQ